MAILKFRLNRKNASGTYDTIHYETSSNIVMRPSGRTVEQDLTDFLPRSQNTDDVPQTLTKGSIVAGSSKIWAGLNSVTELAKKTDVPAPYVHPSSKVCAGGDAGTLNGKTASQIISEATSSSRIVTLYDDTIDVSSWTSWDTDVRTYIYKFSSEDVLKYISFRVYVKATIHYRTASSYGNKYGFTISLVRYGDSTSGHDTARNILTQRAELPNADNTSSAERTICGPLHVFAYHDNGYHGTGEYCMSAISEHTEARGGEFYQVAIAGYTSGLNGLVDGANLSGSSVYVKMQAIRA